MVVIGGGPANNWIAKEPTTESMGSESFPASGDCANSHEAHWALEENDNSNSSDWEDGNDHEI